MKIRYPESENRQGILMFTVLFAGVFVASFITDPIARFAVGFGAYITWIMFALVRDVVIEKTAGTMRHLEDIFLGEGQSPQREQLFIRAMYWIGNITTKTREWWVYLLLVERHEEGGAMADLVAGQPIYRHLFLLPEREDHVWDFRPRRKAASWRGAGPFDHGASEATISQLSKLPFHGKEGELVPIHFVQWGSKIAARRFAGWDDQAKELAETDFDAIMAKLETTQGHQIYPSKLLEIAQDKMLAPVPQQIKEKAEKEKKR